MVRDHCIIMKYAEGQIGKIIIAKLETGDDLLLSIKTITEKNKIKTGSWYAIGTLQKAHFYFYKPKPIPILLNEPLEIVACAGSISYNDEEIIVHGHIDVTDKSFKSQGGHLLEGSIVDVGVFLTILEVKDIDNTVVF